MALFGIGRETAHLIVEEAVATERKRTNQLVAILLTALPKNVLNQKVNFKAMDDDYSILFPEELKIEENDDGESVYRKDVTVKDVLSFIDP